MLLVLVLLLLLHWGIDWSNKKERVFFKQTCNTCIPLQEEFHTKDGQKARWFRQSWMDIKYQSLTILTTSCKFIYSIYSLIVQFYIKVRCKCQMR